MRKSFPGGQNTFRQEAGWPQFAGCVLALMLLTASAIANPQLDPTNILLLDLKMHQLGGFDVLKWLMEHPDCKVIPTIMFSSSAVNSDVHESYFVGANAYMVKPSEPGELRDLTRRAYAFWSRCQTPAPPPDDRCG